MASATRAISPALPVAEKPVSQLPAREFVLPGGRLAYDEIGLGPLVLCVPGLGDLRQEYRFLAPTLAASGFRVICLDIRGHGGSSVGWPSYRPEDVAGDIVAFLRHLGTGPATVVGTSFASGAAALAAAIAPELIDRLVLLGPAVRDVPPASFLKRVGQWLMIRAALAGPWAHAAWATYYRSLYPTRQPPDMDAYLAALRANLREPGRMTAAKGLVHAPKTAVEASLGRVRAPALVVMGTRDPDFPDPAAEAALVAKRLSGHAALIDGAGHYPHAEMPEATLAAILPFLGKG